MFSFDCPVLIIEFVVRQPFGDDIISTEAVDR